MANISWLIITAYKHADKMSGKNGGVESIREIKTAPVDSRQISLEASRMLAMLDLNIIRGAV